MAFKINGVVRIDNSGDGFLGIVTATELDAKVSSKAISEQTEGGISDVTGADELLLLDAESGGLLRVSVDEFVVGAGIGTLVTDFDNLTVTGVTTIATLKGVGGNAVSVGASLIPTANEIYDLGSSTNRFRDIYLSGSTIDMDGHTIGVSTTGLLYDSLNIVTEDNNSSVSFAGSVTAATLYGDGSNLSGVSAGGVNQFVATGTIANGDLVVINVDGTVSKIQPEVGSPVTFNSAQTFYAVSVYDPDTSKVVIAYSDNGNSGRGTAVVGTVSGTSISFGTPVVFESANATNIAITYDSTNDKVVIAYRDLGNSNYGTAVVGTVSGTSISFGTPVVFESASSFYMSATYDSTNQKVVIAYSDGGNSDYGTAVVGTVSGTSISFGTPVVFESATTGVISISFNPAQDKVVIAYSDEGNSGRGTAIVGNVSGTSISFGSAVIFNFSNTTYITSVFDSFQNATVVAHSGGDARVASVSGTSISFGTAVEFSTSSSQYLGATYDSTKQKVVIAFRDIVDSNYGKYVEGTVSGTSISFDDPITFETSDTYDITPVYDSTNQTVVISYVDGGNSDYGKAVIVGTGNLTAENYIGIAAEAISDGVTGNVTTLGGVNSSQTGLTTARTYYIQSDGSIGLTTDSPLLVVAGTSISSTKILVR